MKYLITERGLTQSDVAEKLRLSRVHLGRILSDSQEIEPFYESKILSVFAEMNKPYVSNETNEKITEPQIPYHTARLNRKNSKEWPGIPDKHERARHGRAMAKAMWEEIQMGWLPIEEKQGIFKINTLLESMEEVTEVAWSGKRPRTIHSYTIVKRMFFEWMHKVRLDLIKPKEFNTIYANKYMDHIKIEKRMTGRTWNNHLGYIKIFFNYLLEREIIDKNPFRSIKKQPELKSTKNIAYTEQEQAILNDYLYKNHRPLYYFCRMIYGLCSG